MAQFSTGTALPRFQSGAFSFSDKMEVAAIFGTFSRGYLV
jgi:hypothetical protein